MSILISLLLGLLFSADSTLPNGIRIGEISPLNGEFEIVVGYNSGVRNEPVSGLSSIVNSYLAATDAARSIALTAYGAGGDVQQISELDRTAFRVRVPQWAASAVLEKVAVYLAQTPNASELERARQSVVQVAVGRSGDFRERVEDEIRLGLLGFHPYAHRVPGLPSDLESISDDQVLQYFKDNFGTNHAFVVTTGPLNDDLRSRLAAISKRESRSTAPTNQRVLNAQRILRFGTTDQPAGAVILAAPVPGVYYREWYSFLLLDRLFSRVLPEHPKTALSLTIDPYYWRLEVPVAAGQFADNVDDNLSQDVQRLQFARAKPEDLEAARSETLAFLNSPYAEEWFASEGISERRLEGLQWVQSFTADDIRAAVRDLLLANHVTASWSPKPERPTVDVQILNSPAVATPASAASTESPLPPVVVAPLPPHDHPVKAFGSAEKLTSGVWLAASSAPAIFLAGSPASGAPGGATRVGPNGTLWKFDHQPATDIIKAFQKYRADRILVLAPLPDLDRVKSLWNGIKFNAQDQTKITPAGPVANIDIPALLVLKAEIDRKLIEAGWWADAHVMIDATEGAFLKIEAPAEKKTQILTWIKALATSPLSDADFAWAREAAWNHLNDALADMQSLVWLRDPQYIIQGVETIAAGQVQEAARLYF